MRSDRRITAGWAAWQLAYGLVVWSAVAATAANDAPIADGARVASMEAVRPPTATTILVPGLGHAVGADRFDSYHGGTQNLYQTVNEMRLLGMVNDNVVINVAARSDIVRDGSFASTSGIPAVIQNNGANMLIQNATIVNVQFRP